MLTADASVLVQVVGVAKYNPTSLRFVCMKLFILFFSSLLLKLSYIFLLLVNGSSGIYVCGGWGFFLVYFFPEDALNQT